MVNFGGQSFLDLAGRKLDWIDARTRVLAENVANADTPNFEASDVTPFAATLDASTHALARTCATHLEAGGEFGTQPMAGALETSPDRNNVSLDKQMRLLAETEQDQGLVTTLMKRYTAMTTMALGVSA